MFISISLKSTKKSKTNMCVTEVRVVWFMLTTSYNTAKLITLTVIDV